MVKNKILATLYFAAIASICWVSMPEMNIFSITISGTVTLFCVLIVINILKVQ